MKTNGIDVQYMQEPFYAGDVAYMIKSMKYADLKELAVNLQTCGIARPRGIESIVGVLVRLGETVE